MVLQVAAAVSEDALYLLFVELEKGLEEPTRRSAAAVVLTNFCANSKLDYQENVPSLLTVRLLPFQALWAVTFLSTAQIRLSGVCSVILHSQMWYWHAGDKIL